MVKWSEGYADGIEYTVKFFHELTPENLRFALLQQGLAAPRGRLSYLELGSEHGLTANLVAAANPEIDVVGVDTNPVHVGYARALAERANISNVTFLERGFEELAGDDSLQSFDVIVLHGLYSWVERGDRDHIREIVRRKLKAGGIVYVSYNAYPGWTSGATLQRVIRDGGVLGNGGVVQHVGLGISLLNRLKELDATFFTGNPGAVAWLEDLRKLPVETVARECLNKGWDAFFFSDVAQDFAEAKVTYGGQASLLSQLDVFNLTPDQRQLLASIADVTVRETVRDVIQNTSYRRDIYVRGATVLPRAAQQDLWNNQRFVLLGDPADAPRKWGTRVGEITLNADVYEPVFATLARGPQTLAEIAADAGGAGLKWEQVAEAVHFLTGLGVLSLALPAAGEAERAERMKALNIAIAERIETGDPIQVLASPVTGSGIGLDSLSQLLFAAHAKGVADKAAFVREKLSRKGQTLHKDGAPVAEEDVGKHLDEVIATFETSTLKILQRAGIA